MLDTMTPSSDVQILRALDSTHTARHLAMAVHLAARNISLEEEMNAVRVVVDALQEKLDEIGWILEEQNEAMRGRRVS